ncbi:hypothetical protein ACQRBF_00055 [Peptoniphilaceae bacterium SGI.131]
MIDERTLPIYLQKDITQFKEGLDNKDISIDIYWCELYGSINSAMVDMEISKEVASFLRKKYLKI